MKNLLRRWLGIEALEQDYRLLSELYHVELGVQARRNLHFEGAINGLRARVKAPAGSFRATEDNIKPPPQRGIVEDQEWLS